MPDPACTSACPQHEPPASVGAASPPLLLRVEEAAERLSLSRATVNRLLAGGVLPSVKLGRARRVVYRDLEQFVQDLADGRLYLDDALLGGAR